MQLPPEERTPTPHTNKQQGSTALICAIASMVFFPLILAIIGLVLGIRAAKGPDEKQRDYGFAGAVVAGVRIFLLFL